MKLPKALWRPASPSRIEIIDGLRGVAIILMVIHHALYDAVYYLGAPGWLFQNALFTPLSRFFEGVFIILSGVSCRFSHSNLRRALEMLAAALVVSAVTYMIGNPIRFGILHFLGASALLVGIFEKVFPRALKIVPRETSAQDADAPAEENVPRETIAGKPAPDENVSQCNSAFVQSANAPDEAATPLRPFSRRRDIARAAIIVVCAILFVILWRTIYGELFDFKGFAWLGFRYPGYSSSDYFPLLPWICLYIAGVAAGGFVVERRLPVRFYTAKVPFFAAVGRNTMLVYLLHQPVLYGITMIVKLFI